MITTCGTATGWSAGQAPFVAYAMCCLWSGLSVRVPSQHSGKITWRRRAAAPQFGTVCDGFTFSIEQFQKTVFVLCGVDAVESPPIIMKPTGNGLTGAIVLRR